MKAKEVHAAYDCNWSKCMRELGLGNNTYKYWLKHGYIPMPTQLKIEKLTDGRLKADLNREEL